MRLSYDPLTHRRCIACPYKRQPPLRRIVGLSKLHLAFGLPTNGAVLLTCGHSDSSYSEFRALHPEWTWTERADLFGTYFNIADELSDPNTTLEDLDGEWIVVARAGAETYGLSWPPDLAEAEEFSLDHPELRG